MSHDEPARYVDVKVNYMERLASLVDQLKAVPEGDGTLFGNTLILACSEHGMASGRSTLRPIFRPCSSGDNGCSKPVAISILGIPRTTTCC